MKTRELTTDERTALDSSYDEYLNIAKQDGVTFKLIAEAWEAYKQTMLDMNVITTLAGYRVKL